MNNPFNSKRPDRQERAFEIKCVKPPKVDNVDDYVKIIDAHANLEKAKGARRMLIWCIIVLFAVYIADIIIVGFELESSLTDSLFELMKFLITTLVGYSFANGNLFSKE